MATPSPVRPGQAAPKAGQSPAPAPATEMPDDIAQVKPACGTAARVAGAAGPSRPVWIALATDLMQAMLQAVGDAFRLTPDELAQVVAGLSSDGGAPN